MLDFSEYRRYDALGLADLVRRGEVSSLELLDTALARCEAVNPALNAVIRQFPERARHLAATARAEAPFAGVPFLLKDLLAALAGEVLGYGCAALQQFRPAYDSELVRRFLAAGLVPFGKTSTPEFGLLGYTEPKAHGPCRNPWSLSHTPGGSSGGAAAAVAAGIVPLAHGGDGGGSIRIPAANCGLFGLKPSRGRVPQGPDFAEVWSGAVQEHALSRSVRDSAALLDAIAGPDVGAPYRIAPSARSYLECVATPPERLCIGAVLESSATPIDPDCRQAVETTIRLLEDLGHRVEVVALPYEHAVLVECYLSMYYGEVAAALDWLAEVLGRPVEREDVELETWILARLGRQRSAGEQTRSRQRWNELSRAMGRFHLHYDLLLTPTLATPPVRIGELATPARESLGLKWADRLGLSHLLLGSVHREARRSFARLPFTQLANLTGQPAMSLPLHWNQAGLPIGVQLVAAINREDLLFSLAGELESAAPWFDKVPPEC
ncbi:amidase [Chitinimonas lacunae]|uniref:Amidase n=1 Tax=Chitinimonas lacunae TaxID=1963018 RepID=A0ABV8MPI9_9NEIS